MTVDWMFQGQADVLHSILILVSTYISAHLIYLAICLEELSTCDTVTSGVARLSVMVGHNIIP